MPRETVAEKAVRFISQERVRFQVLTPEYALATVHGDTNDYETGYKRRRWYCSCMNATESCSHIRAARMIFRAIIGAIQKGETTDGNTDGSL